MATLEERIQNLTQEVNPMGSGVMSDQDVERMYNIDIDGKNINVDILRSNEKCECVKVLEDFVDEIGLDNKKVDIIKSLIWLNMAPLHPQPIGDFLFYFGKYNLYLNL